jgi:hypothetical protein
MVALVGGTLVYQSFARVAPGPVLSESDRQEGILKRVYAGQMIPPGSRRNVFAQGFRHTGSGTRDDGTGGLEVTPINPMWTFSSGRWEKSWPDKIQVCVVAYVVDRNLEHTVELNVRAIGDYKKTQVLQKLTNRNPSNLWPKYEFCSDPISKHYTPPAKTGRPNLSSREVDAYMINMTTKSICAKPGLRANSVSDARCSKTSYGSFASYLEQYIIRAVK